MTQDELINEATAEIAVSFQRWSDEGSELAQQAQNDIAWLHHVSDRVGAVLTMLASRSHDLGWYAALRHTHDLAKDVESEIAAGCYDPDYERGFYRCFEKIEEVINEGKESE